MTDPENIKSHPEKDDQRTQQNLSTPEIEEGGTGTAQRAPDAIKRVTTKNNSPSEVKRGRPPRETPEAAKWSMRGVEPETRTALNKAAEKLGKTIGEFFNTDLRTYATEILQDKLASPPAAPRDIEQMIEARMTTMGASLGATLSARLAEEIANHMQAVRPAEEPKKGLLARILGK